MNLVNNNIQSTHQGIQSTLTQKLFGADIREFMKNFKSQEIQFPNEPYFFINQKSNSSEILEDKKEVLKSKKEVLKSKKEVQGSYAGSVGVTSSF